MTSKLAQAQIEKWWSEGLHPSVNDIVRVNDLGLAVERGVDMFDFSSCPRAAFLGDRVLWEPTLRKRLWIDAATQIVDANTLESRIYVMAYALGTPSNELADLTSKRKLAKAVVKFRDEVLMDCTDSQVIAALGWCLNGNKVEVEDDDADVTEPPDPDGRNVSVAKQILLQAIGSGMDNAVADYALLDDLRKMVLVASIHKGVDVVKNEHTQNAGRFYVECGKIHERLLKEKTEKEEKKDGEV